MPPVLSKMLSAKGSEEARSLLAEFIAQFTSRRSFWFVINSLGEHVYDLIHHFGLERLDYMALLLAAGLIKIDKNNKVTYEGAQWELFAESYFDASEVEYTGMRTTIPNEGRVQCHLLRIGDKAQTSYLYEDYPRPRINNFSNQLKFDDRAMQPPKPAGLRAEQRRLFRLGRNLIMKQIIHSIDTTNYFEDYLTKIDTTDMKSATATTTKEVATSAAATTKASAAITKTTTEAAESANSSCSQPSPAKKQRRDDAATTSKQMTPSYSNLSRDVDELDKALKERSDAEYVDKCVDNVFADIVALKENCSVIGYKDKRLHDVSLVRVPKATTNKSFAQSDGWVDKAISINSPDDKYNGIRRLMQKLVKINEDAVLEALDNVGMKVATPMNETKLAAMFKHGNLNFTQQQKILQHLRDHYGKKAFASLQKIAMFCEDHTYVNTGEIEYRYEEDGVLETIDYYEKNIASEVQKQLGFAIASLEKSVTLIKRIDVVIGGDHGAGAFVAGAKVIVTFEDTTAHYFDVSVAEVTCRKDNAEILQRTIYNELTKGLETMAKNIEGHVQVKSIRVVLTVTGDLAWYAAILGKESMSGHWCHLCKLSRKEFTNLLLEGDEWTTEAMIQTAREVEMSHDKKPKYGVKSKLWWDFIPIQNYVVPLLHTLIGIGNDLLDNLRDTVDKYIERITLAESRARSSLTAVEETIASVVAEREAFDASANGKKLKSVKAKIRVRKAALKRLGALQEEQQEMPQEPQNEQDVSIFLDNVDMFVTDADNGVEIVAEEDDNVAHNDDAHDNDEPTAEVNNAEENNTNPNTTNNNADTDAVAKQILNRRAELVKFLAEEKTLQTQRDAITKRLNQARKYASKLKEKLAEWRSQRKRKDGIESKMDKVLKQVGVEIQRYHGGSLTGKDIIKVVGNATFIFDEFAKIFKEHRREDGWDDDKIENLCASYKLTFLLWDGAFSHARTVNPTEHDFSMYSRYVKAAVHCHVKIGCSVTPKVHLMLKHTLYQMKNIEGGLGDKMEDWVELMHQTGQRMRVRFRTVKCRQVRASAMAKVVQMNSIPELDEQIEGVTQRASNPRKTNKVEDDHKNRVERRLSALRAFESGEAAISKE